MGLRSDFVRAKRVNEFEPASNLDELMVSNSTGPYHEIMGKDYWLKMNRPLPPTSGPNAIPARYTKRPAP